MTTWPLVKSRLRSRYKRIAANLTKKKGSLRNPLLYLGTISVILLSVICFGADFIFKTTIKQEDFSFLASVSDALKQPCHQFVSAVQKTGAKSLDLSLIQQNSLRGIATPNAISFQVLGSLVGGSEDYLFGNDPVVGLDSGAITEYVIEEDDTLSSVAEKFDISVETILWVNDLSKSSVLKVGQKLIILPVSGTLHYVQKGDTLSEIAKTYKADMNEIVIFNELSNEGDIYIGDILIVPNGTKPKPAAVAASPQVSLASSYFIRPIASPCKITQGLHFSNAIDFSNGVCGSPIYAAASGQILRIKYGYNNGAGNYLTILHPNGVVTMYGHLQAVLVSQGDNVSQGQTIALMGGQPGTPGAGRSTGCHLHFQVQGAKNPFAK